MRLRDFVMETGDHSNQAISSGNDLASFDASFASSPSSFADSKKPDVKVFGTLKSTSIDPIGSITVNTVADVMNSAGSTITIGDGSSTRIITGANTPSADSQFQVSSMANTPALATAIASAINGSVGGSVAVTATPDGSTINLSHDSGGTIAVSIAIGSASSSIGAFITIGGTGLLRAAGYSMFVVPPAAAPANTFNFSKGVPVVTFGFSSHNSETDKLNLGILLVGEAK